LNLQPSEANMLPSTATASMASRFFWTSDGAIFLLREWP
jgi:hypothetical protein